MKKKINKFFNISKDETHKTITILGIKIRFKYKNLIEYRNDFLENYLSEIYKKLKKEYILIGEEKIIPLYFKELENANIKTQYENLVKNLDDESMINVQKVINRIRQLLKNGHYVKDYFDLNKDEIERIEERKADFYKSIVQIDDEVWAYKNYFLPCPYFETPIFIDKCNINYFSKIDRSKAIIDAGAYSGDSALILSDYTDDKVYAFEPTNNSYALLEKTIKLNNSNKIIPIKFGLSNKEYEDTIYTLDAASTILDFRADGKNAEKIKITTIDDFVKKNNLRVGLIKADIEGLEQQMLIGAKKAIMQQKPNLMISIYHSSKDFFEIKPMIESWNLGYKFKITKPFEQNILTETCLIAEIM